MAKFGKVDFKQLKINTLNLKNSLDGNVIDNFMKELMLELAFRAVRKIKKRTPVGEYSSQVAFTTKAGEDVRFTTKVAKTGGNLRRNWQVGEVIRNGNSYTIEIYNSVEYCKFVEYGHKTKDHKGWVKGKFMATISIDEIEREIPKYIERKQKELLSKIFNSK